MAPLGLTRRELLATFLGAPLAAACARRGRPPLPPGEIAGTAHALGHRVRDHQGVVPPAGAWSRAPVVIVGGGVAGLAAAWRLARQGVGFVLLELEPALGGTSRSGVAGASPFPWGAHYITAPTRDDPATCVLLGELGLLEAEAPEKEPEVAEQHLCRDPEERVFYRGRWYEGLYLEAGASRADLAELAAFQAEIARWAAWRDARGRRAFTIPTARCSDDAEPLALDRLTAAEWLEQHGWTSPRLRWLVDYACRDDYGTAPADTSAWAAVFYFASRLPAPGAPVRPVVTWPEGNGRLVAHLATRAGLSGGRALTGVAVTDLVPTETGVEVTALRAADGSAFGVHAEQVIFAAPQLLARHVIRPFRDAPPPHLHDFEYGAWMVANLQLTGRPVEPGFPLAWDNVLHDSPALGYVVATHQLGLERGPTVFTYYFALVDREPHKARDRLLSLGQPEWADVVLSDLARPHPDLPGLVERLDVMRWGHAMVRPRPGLRTRGTLARAAAPYRGIHFAHADLSGLALFEESLDHGVRAAEEVLAARGITSATLR